MGFRLMPCNLFADEGGVSFWTPGNYDSLAAETQVPGWALSVTEYHDAVSAGAEASLARLIRIGQVPTGVVATINAHFSENTDLLTFAPTYVFATPVFGGQASIGLSGSYGRDSDTLAATLAGNLTSNGNTLPFARSDSINQSVWGFGDPSPLFTLRWHEGANSFMTYLTGNIPVGAYDPARLSNLGIGHSAIDAGGAYTYHDERSGHEISGTLGFTYNFINPSTQYQSGVDMHFDWGASQFLTKELHVGLAGYAYKEIGCDSGSGDRVGCFQSQVFGIGPQLGVTFPVSGLEGSLGLKAYREFAAQNGPDGWSAWVTFALSPSESKSDNAAIPKVAK
jgi:hypothetical protein